MNVKGNVVDARLNMMMRIRKRMIEVQQVRESRSWSRNMHP